MLIREPFCNRKHSVEQFPICQSAKTVEYSVLDGTFLLTPPHKGSGTITEEVETRGWGGVAVKPAF